MSPSEKEARQQIDALLAACGLRDPWTKKLWIYDLSTNQHFTLETNSLKRSDLDEFVQLYGASCHRHLERGDPRRPLALL